MAPVHSRPSRWDSDADELKDLQAELKRRHKLLENLPTKPIFPDIPRHIAQRKLDPDGVNDTDRAFRKRIAFLSEGRSASLAECLAEIAVEIDPNPSLNSVWRHLKGDDNRLVMQGLVDSMWGALIEALIDGNVFERHERDPEFRRGMDYHHPLRQTPGNYGQQLGRTSTQMADVSTPSTQQSLADRRVVDKRAIPQQLQEAEDVGDMNQAVADLDLAKDDDDNDQFGGGGGGGANDDDDDDNGGPPRGDDDDGEQHGPTDDDDNTQRHGPGGDDVEMEEDVAGDDKGQDDKQSSLPPAPSSDPFAMPPPPKKRPTYKTGRTMLKD